MQRRTALSIAAAALGVAILAALLLHVCADGGAMGGAYRTCECRGLELELYDRMAADGPRRTICVGLVRSRTCLESRDGEAVPCAG
ncbi:MAG TPA: hypothetical protein VLE53_16495 [Gemmatimonadaceae bacterium]|nr:hypothetical protein [Gemmatimonadaceae bacterium]